MKIPKQQYKAEFKELAVKRVRDGQSAGVVAKELGLIEQTLRNGIKAAEAGKLKGAHVKVVTPEQMERSRLRAENVRLKQENEILKKPRRTLQGTPCEVAWMDVQLTFFLALHAQHPLYYPLDKETAFPATRAGGAFRP